MPSFLAFVRTETKPPLFSGNSVQKNSRVFLSVILSLSSELPPITPTLTVYHSFADSTPVKSNSEHLFVFSHYERPHQDRQGQHQHFMDHGFPQFITVIESCSTVAIDTQTKYGTWATATQR